MTDDAIRTKLRVFICSELLGDPGYPLRDDAAVLSSGLIDSFYLAHLAVFIEDEFGVVIPDVDLTVENFDSIDLMVALVLTELLSKLDR